MGRCSLKKILETERLVLRELDAVADAPFLLGLLNEPAFLRYVGDRGVRSVDDASEYIRSRILPSYGTNGFGFYVVQLKANGEPVGICGLARRDGMKDVDVGFSTAAPHWQRGYGFEAASALMAHGRAVHGLERIVAVADPENAASVALLQKLGLRFSRMIRLPGQERDTGLFE